jgi:TonB family protein
MNARSHYILILSTILLLVGGTALAQKTNGGTVSTPRDTVKLKTYEAWEFEEGNAPQVADYDELVDAVVYPEEAKEAKIEGMVVLLVLVDTNGRAAEAKVQLSDNPILNEAAITAVRSVQYVPGKQNGKPVNAWLSIPIRFSLD